ncbi:hypothetical protein QSV36_18040 [Pseudomonas sp. BCRC 81390]|uniref:hypothetical protein n=1 Tax=Pseudomonas sp. BCRC 81390 TaxID=3054778 RepID=UPI0025912E3C|nr:hypothetical protein [Pseudomonas sp. BCRC 81390]MDM3887476.1 hypothetical protein [Pseudomonas sp. BCRC 81390]
MLEQLLHVCVMFAVSGMFFLPGLGDVRLPLDGCRQPGGGLLPVTHGAVGFRRGKLEPGGDLAFDGGVVHARLRNRWVWHIGGLA